MTLNESKKEVEDRIALAQVKLDALKGLRKQHFEFEPASHEFVTFYVHNMEYPGDAQPVQAVKRPNTTNGWAWITPQGDLRFGHWTELIAEITAGPLFPATAIAGHGQAYEFLGA